MDNAKKNPPKKGGFLQFWGLFIENHPQTVKPLPLKS